MRANIHFRSAELADVPVLLALPRSGDAGPDPRLGKYLAGEHHPQQALPSRAIFIAFEGANAIGYIAGHLTRRFGCDGELQWLYVVREHRRLGVASALLRLIAQWLLRAHAKRVCVDVGNEEARSFYTRHGAVPLNPHWMVWPDISMVLDEAPAPPITSSHV